MTARSCAALVEADILGVWAEGRARSAPDRAIAMLAAGVPAVPRDDLDGWPVGIRDAWLMDLRAATFGHRIEAGTECPRCGEQVQVEFDAADVRVAAERRDDERPAPVGPLEVEFVAGSSMHRVVFALPSTADLRAVARCRDAREGRRGLIERCVILAEREGEPVEASELPEVCIAEMARAIEARDPQAVLRLRVTCPACSDAWGAEFDIASFLWEEVDLRARRLIGEVHALAAAYGWSEAGILALPAARRSAYLDLVMG